MREMKIDKEKKKKSCVGGINRTILDTVYVSSTRGVIRLRVYPKLGVIQIVPQRKGNRRYLPSSFFVVSVFLFNFNFLLG